MASLASSVQPAGVNLFPEAPGGEIACKHRNMISYSTVSKLMFSLKLDRIAQVSSTFSVGPQGASYIAVYHPAVPVLVAGIDLKDSMVNLREFHAQQHRPNSGSNLRSSQAACLTVLSRSAGWLAI